MAGMAANISAFNTVFSYDLWQDYVVKDRDDSYYLLVGRIATVAATVIAILTATFASNFSNIMDYLQTLFGFFNAPLFATFILGMFWKRMTATAGWMGLVAGTLAAVAVAFLSRGRVRLAEHGRDPDRRPGRGVPRGLGGLRRRHRGQRRGLRWSPSRSRPSSCAGWSTPRRRRRSGPTPRRRRTRGTAAPSRWPASRWPWSSS